jgi:hypothetical protein
MGSRQLNAVLGSLVVTCGLWLIWADAPPAILALVVVTLAALLNWGTSSLPAMWMWATGLIGLESLAWPMLTMIRVKMTGREPTEQEMGIILTAMLFGLFSSIFWLTFSYGIFKRFVRTPPDVPPQAHQSRSGGRSN